VATKKHEGKDFPHPAQNSCHQGQEFSETTGEHGETRGTEDEGENGSSVTHRDASPGQAKGFGTLTPEGEGEYTTN